ncbi:conjugal transfer protein TrbL [Brevibacterium casei]|uniref:conjugal transfer protein TrbL n=1 Tax=Brevibacterium casei TaxID=33889 RepID=UPI000E6542AA|nr:conjugal transfer protein TrbL [Brevibacterium casei]MBE4696206.1 conjugal transfer protein TrbL [Brevibacterium casei]MBY3579328.1 conjugal transfer protein TrbL [Brevibacterium casei]MCT1765489.1 conjugal transfer protein TrbL [Brevibacterium casei]
MSVCDIPVISNVCDAVGEGTASLIAAPFDWLASSMAGAAAWLMETMWAVFDTTTLVDLNQDGFVSVYNIVFGIALFVIAIFFFLQLITGMIQRDPGALSRAALGAGKSILGSFVVITLTTVLLEIVDQLCIGLIQAAGETTESMGNQLLLLSQALAGLNIAAPGVGAIVSIFLAGLMIAAIGIVWFSLLIRKALILVTVVLAPLALSGASWDVTKGWIGKWVTFLIALIVSKLVLVVVFLVAITQVATPIDAGLTAVTEPIAGIVLLGIAAFAPYMVYRLLSFVGFDLYNTMGAEQDAKNAMNRPLPIPSKAGGDGPKKILDGAGDSGGDGDGGGSPPATKPAASTETAGTETATAEAGTETAASTGPATPVVAGVMVANEAAEAGPAAGNEVGTQADNAAAGAQNTGNTTDPAGDGGSGGGTPPAPSAPVPNTPTEPSAPADPGPAGGKE